MVIVTINNSMSKIEGLASGPFNRLRKELSYKKDDYHSRSPFPQVKHMIDKRGEFPTGLLARVKKYLVSEGISAQFVDLRRRPTSTPGMFRMKL